jgi:hypothetical protein
MTPQFKFTIFHATLAPTGTEVEQPLGWKDSSISLQRHETYHSLVEYFKGSFVWYGSARDLIIAIEALDGPDARPRILIEITFNSSTYETLFDGLIDLSQLEDISRAGSQYKCTCPIIRSDFWSKLINRKSTQVDLLSTTDLDGNAITPVSKVTLDLPSQIVRANFERLTGFYPASPFEVVTGATPGTNQMYFMFGNSSPTRDEVTERLDYGIQVVDTNSFPPSLDKYFFKVQYTGDYDIALSIRYSISWAGSLDIDIQWKLAIRTGGTLTEYNIGSSQSDTGVGSLQDDGARTYSNTFSLDAGDQIFVYALVTMSSAPTISFQVDYDPGGGAVYTAFTVVANTTFPDTESDGFLIKDALENVLRGILGGTSIITSTYFGTCGWNNAIAKGKHIRGYSFSDKAFSLSLDDWWAGVNPLLNLGLGYSKVAGVDHIEVEQIATFFNPTPSLFISNVPDIVRTYDQKKFIKSLDVGYDKWAAESDGGVDDPQTKSTYASPLATIGSDQKITSKFIAASIAIEQTRRNQVKFGKDWRLDEDTMIIQVKSDGGGGYTPVVGADFSTVSNLLNSSTRYNIAHTPARMLLRWLSWLQSGLQNYVGSVLRFTKGEGNYSVSSTTSDTCETSGAVTDGTDITITSSKVCLPKMYKAKIPMTWADYKTIRDNAKKAIAISPTESVYLPMFIDNMDYHIAGGSAELSLILGSETPVTP